VRITSSRLTQNGAWRARSALIGLRWPDDPHLVIFKLSVANRPG
jgi:hypothetical protein